MEAAYSPETAIAIVPALMFLTMGALYVAFLVFIVWAIVSVVRALRRIADAQEQTVARLDQIVSNQSHSQGEGP